jgi:2-polyprenyl-3-methyl-5-hydroxy-6-metoxy-1,4-benzoquinol methylase
VSTPVSCSQYQEKVRDLVEGERSHTCGAESRAAYETVHAFRFRHLLDLCRHQVPSPDASVLDVGRSGLTALLTSYYHSVATIGLELDADDGGHRENAALVRIPHIVFDLNRSADVAAWPQTPGAFDLIVYSETIEHIHVAPEFTLLMLSSLLKDGGKIVVSTPNAASLRNRICLLLGINPFERIRYYPMNPGDFREYTARELRDMAEVAGLRCLRSEWIDFYRRGRQSWVASLRDSLIAIYEKPIAGVSGSNPCHTAKAKAQSRK